MLIVRPHSEFHTAYNHHDYGEPNPPVAVVNPMFFFVPLFNRIRSIFKLHSEHRIEICVNNGFLIA